MTEITTRPHSRLSLAHFPSLSATRDVPDSGTWTHVQLDDDEWILWKCEDLEGLLIVSNVLPELYNEARNLQQQQYNR